MSAYDNKIVNFNPTPLAYYPLNEGSGTTLTESINGWNGTYTGIQWGIDRFIDGSPVPFFDGANDFGNIYTTALRDAFSGVAGTVALWAKVSGAGVWTDGVGRYMVRIRANADNEVILFKSSTNNLFVLRYEAGATVNFQNVAATPTAWFHVAITWDKNAGGTGEVKYYYNGSASGATDTGLGTWVGTPSSTDTVIGASSTVPATVWDGYLAHCAVWTSALTAAQVADLYKVPMGKRMHGVLGSQVIQGT